ncbi:hypothetical protein RJT34_33523 [Clitoria ternatea]|uniref:Uncharacterized protein n=1 Tax=Clitoria ternatea TaxID=43366 RepID=A0AAN9I3A1_CLITE
MHVNQKITRMSCSGSPKKRQKSEVDDDDVYCGICYAGRGVSIAGEIDSCKHYFCFVCIMEWAKHESRCPICRQRFSNVRRLPMLGVISSSRDVKVPLRDQVYHPFGNMATGPVDSYAEANCTVCHVGTDENLLLLCDLCDCASHTYCVGLGYTVPEGDWYCPDCVISRETNHNEESNQQNVEAEAGSSVTILDILRETGSQVVRRPRASPLLQNQSSTTFVIPLPDRLSRFKGKKPVLGKNHLQRNAQALRENWNALRNGSLCFHSNSSQPGSTLGLKQDSSSLSHGKLDRSHSMACTSHQQSTVQGGPSILNERDSKDIDRAWEMLDRAKRMQQTHLRTKSIPQGVDKPSSSTGTRKISLAHCNHPELKNQHSKALDLRNTEMKQCDYSRVTQNLENHRPLKLEERKQSRVTCEETVQHARNRNVYSEGYRASTLPKNVHTNIQGAPCSDDGERNLTTEQSWSNCLVGSADSAPSHGKFGNMFSSDRGVDLVIEEKRLAKSLDGNTRKIDNAKTEIQSLVKLNLKLLTRDKQLGVDTFKVIARQATHTILAACSSEQQECSTNSSSTVCNHGDHTLQFQKSTLMPNCCRQCFYAFVNNVVSSIILEKVGCA